MKNKDGKSGLIKNRNKYAYTFVAHWALGLILFFGYPLISSIWYGFNEVSIIPGKIVTEFKGFENFTYLLQKDPDFINNMRDSIISIFYSLPIIISVSIIIAVLLNQKFFGRTVIRAVFFIPVILSTSVVMNILSGDSSIITVPLFSSGKSGMGIIDYEGILKNLNFPNQVLPFLTFLLSHTISLIWSCGVQTILFLAGLQSIPTSLYEVSKIEGANKWEEFWLITVPSLRHIISLVLIYTMIDLFADMKNKVVSIAYSLMVTQNFGSSSAMLWMYFLIVITVIVIIYTLYQKLCVKRWE